ncbi:MAG: hypothetical protein AAGA87_10845 [Pseudomonadota bacterium]
MSFIRPEALAALIRWRQALIGVVVCVVALYFVITDYGIRQIIASIACAVGLLLIWDGFRRVRFPAPGGGAGVVEVNEREVTYFGPSGGGSVSIDQLVLVRIRTTDAGPFETDLFWEFVEETGTVLTVPGNAENASALFDALSALPGADYEAATRAAGSTDNATFDVWRAPVRQLH